DRRRRLPSLALRTFADAFAHRAPGSGPGSGPILFNDTFTNFCHPNIGMAAADVLGACGAAPALTRHDCCGRPLSSKGLLAGARALARANADALYEAASQGRRIVFLEPSCLSAVKEDAPALLRGDEQRRARTVADACVLFEDFVESRVRAGASLPLANGPASILLHGHCHQKAMGLLPSARLLLARIPGSTIVDLDAGCCGMAGSCRHPPARSP